MIDYYTARQLGGNTRKVSIMLAESETDHIVHFVDLDAGEQGEQWFTAINPNGRIPAIVDHDAPGELRLGESGAILIHLAEKTGRFLPTDRRLRAQAIQWVFWQVGHVGPTFGQWSYFGSSAPVKVGFAIERFRDEATRLLSVLNRQLLDHEFAAGDFSIADMALYSWIKPGFAALERNRPDLAASWQSIPRWLAAVGGRPKVALAMTKYEGSALRIGRG